MKIALCEDEKKYIDSVCKILDDYVAPDGEPILYEVFANALSLLDATRKEKFDAVLIDIIMPGLSGMEAARDIRQQDMSIPIIFITNSPEYAVESYRVRAFDYLMKPIRAEELFDTLNNIYAITQTKAYDNLTVTFSKGTYVIPFEKLVYLEIRNRTLFFHMLNGSCMETSGRISDYEEILLSHTNYLKVHRSFIVNMDHMKSYDRKNFHSVTGEAIPISRTIVKEVQSSYMDYLHAVVRGK